MFLLFIFILLLLFSLPVFRRRMKLRGMSSWVSCRRKRKKWGKCSSKESKRRRLSSKKQRKRYSHKTWMLPCLEILHASLCLRKFLLLSWITQSFFCPHHIAAWEIWPFKEAPPGREKESGGKEEVPGRRAQHVQTEKDCCRALAEPSPAGRGLHHTQEGQREEKVSIVFFLLWLPHICPYILGAGDTSFMRIGIVWMLWNQEATYCYTDISGYSSCLCLENCLKDLCYTSVHEYHCQYVRSCLWLSRWGPYGVN